MQPDAHYPPSSGAYLRQRTAGECKRNSKHFCPIHTKEHDSKYLILEDFFQFCVSLFLLFENWGKSEPKNIQEDIQTRGLQAGQHQQASHYVVIIIHIQQEQKINFGWLSGSLVVMINLSMFAERLMSISLCILNAKGLSGWNLNTAVLTRKRSMHLSGYL